MNKAQEYNILAKFDKEGLGELKQLGNMSLHDYDNIKNEIIEKVIHAKLPKLRDGLQKILKETKKELPQDLQIITVFQE